MSVDIQKQLDLHPYSDKNVVQKPVVQTQPQVQPPADEEKSNAAKWMIGLSATAVIVLGGLYAAKHGHLGKNAEKFAKRIFGEGTTEAKSSSVSSGTTVSNDGNSNNQIPPALTFISLAALRKVIKNPKINQADFLAELEKLGLAFEHSKSDANTFILRTGEKDLPTFVKFDAEGALNFIRKPFNDSMEIFRYENGVLKEIERFITTGVKENPIQHIMEFNPAGKLKKHLYEFKLNDETIRLESLDGNTHLFRNADNINSEGEYLVQRLGQNLKELPEKIRSLKFKFKDRVTSPKIEYARDRRLDLKVTSEIKSEELVEAFIPRSSKYFEQAVHEINVARKNIERAGQNNGSVRPATILNQYRDWHYSNTSFSIIKEEKFNKAITYLVHNKDIAPQIAKLIKNDIGEMKYISLENLNFMVNNYVTTLRAHGIKKPEQFEVVAKPLNKCSKQDFIALLGSRDAVHKKLPGCFDDYGMLDVEYLSSLPGFSHVKNNMTPFDILQDLAK